MTRGVVLGLCLAALCAVTSGCAAKKKAVAAPEASCPKAAHPAWQALANRIGAPVYCPSWMPDPLDGVIGSRWSNIDSVSKDGSYLEGWVWQEVGSGELHVNLRGYKGRTAIPKCPGDSRRLVPCFADPRGHVHARGIDATVYTVNRGADQWHVLYAWRREGSLYTLSEHVAPPLNYTKVRAYLDRMLRGLVLVEPTSA